MSCPSDDSSVWDELKAFICGEDASVDPFSHINTVGKIAQCLIDVKESIIGITLIITAEVILHMNAVFVCTCISKVEIGLSKTHINGNLQEFFIFRMNHVDRATDVFMLYSYF